MSTVEAWLIFSVGWCDRVVVLARGAGGRVATERSSACPLPAGEVRDTPLWRPAGKIRLIFEEGREREGGALAPSFDQRVRVRPGSGGHSPAGADNDVRPGQGACTRSSYPTCPRRCAPIGEDAVLCCFDSRISP